MSTLPLLPDSSWSKVLCIVAHPDDMEYGASAAVSMWTRRGMEVSYVLLTAGEAGMAAPPEETAPARLKEQQAACASVGVSDLSILGYPDGMLEPSLGLRKDIARTIRQHKPDAVLTANYEVEAYGGLNQADHRVAGLAVADAVCDAANPWVFRKLVEEEGLAAWTTKALLVAGHDSPTHAVEIDEVGVKAAVASLQAHASYLEHVTGHPKPEDFIPEILRGGGEAAGVQAAETFRVFDMGGLEGK
ncbi:PIG-L deacetylase family protein [Flaviflexus massiliensis]|uniref:PIG-L deacetylase family protein n=1 Tax=Flaviflexus massiliensis TaxID=1522309 RepID=UPI0006D54DE9|nr:PIG-L family deacetylase [Flaviflexus massiliensis]